MNTFKYTFKIFALILIITFIGDKLVFYTMNKISDKVYSGQSVGKLNQYLTMKDSLDLIIFGSSRANHNINPDVINKNGFNMGMDGRMIAFSGTLIKLLPDKKQTILLHIDPKYAYSKTYYGKDLDALLIKYNRNKIIKNEIDKHHQNNVFQNFLWSISYNSKVFGILKNYIHPKYNYKKYNGFDPIYPTKTQQNIFKKILATNKKKQCPDNLKLNKVYAEYIDEIKEFCNKNNKKLIIFTSPIYNDICKEDNNKLKKLMDEKHIEYYDFSDFFSNDNKIEYWKDETHLSAAGAKIFSKRIAKLLNDNKLK